MALVDAKRTAEGTPWEKEATLACSAGLAAADHDFTALTAQKMRDLKPSFKLWWKKAKEVMKHEAQVSSRPALRTNDGAWVLNAQGKANLFADTFFRESGSFHVRVAIPFQNATSAQSLRRPSPARQRSNVWPHSRASMMKALLVQTLCLHESLNVAQSSWPSRYSSCCNECQRQRVGLSLGVNTGFFLDTKRKLFLFQPAITEEYT